MSFYSEFATYYERVFPFREEVYAFLKGYAGAHGCSVLDIGCGPGHYCCRFARDGFAVQGLDLDSRMIEAASANCPDVSFHCKDMSGVERMHGPFRLVYAIGNVFSHLHPEKLGRFVASVHSLLSPGGYWVFQVVNWDAVLERKEYVFPIKVIDEGETGFHRRYSGITREQVVFEFSLRKGDATLFSEQLVLYPVTSGGYRQLHEAAGFISAAILGGFDAEAFSPEGSSALLMVFRKRA